MRFAELPRRRWYHKRVVGFVCWLPSDLIEYPLDLLCLAVEKCLLNDLTWKNIAS